MYIRAAAAKEAAAAKDAALAAQDNRKPVGSEVRTLCIQNYYNIKQIKGHRSPVASL